MRRLFHFELCPFSRKVRVFLQEKDLGFKATREDFWLKRKEFLTLNPLGQVPVLLEDNGFAIVNSTVIAEFIEDLEPNRSPLIPKDILVKAEAKRINAWFDEGFFPQVTKPILEKKILQRYTGSTDNANLTEYSANLRKAGKFLRFHLDYLEWLLKKRDWLAIEGCSIADISVASHLSVADYLNIVPWGKYPQVKDWYAKMKSRPSFRFILEDSLDILTPPIHYADPDF